MAGMQQRRFVIANVASAFIWAPAHIYPAQMAGLSIDRLRQGDWQSALVWAAVLLGCIAAGWAVHHAIIRKRV
jgi:undecaprenyl-diphosphatase